MDKKEFIKKEKEYLKKIELLKQEIAKTVVDQEETVNSLIRGLLCNGHVLVEGVPGIAKTLLVRTLSKVTGGDFSRIQFTPDLLPTDITGISTYEKDRGFYVLKGPVFANFVLADEINRAPPKVQSALLEAMQERQVTIGKETFELPSPFLVMATQNPLEQFGTFPLPEAQLDRFLFKVFMDYPNVEMEKKVLKQNITLNRFEDYELNTIITPSDILELQGFVKEVFLNEKIEEYIVKLVDATRHPLKYRVKSGRFIEWGASPRASLGMFIASKSEAFLRGQHFVTPSNVKAIAKDILRHRIILNYEGQTEGATPDAIIGEILQRVPVP